MQDKAIYRILSVLKNEKQLHYIIALEMLLQIS